MKTQNKTAGKTAKFIGLLFLAAGLIFTSCKKKEEQTTPEVQNARVFSFDLTFDMNTQDRVYEDINGFDTNDVILTFVKTDVDADGHLIWTQLPDVIEKWNYAHIFPEFNGKTADLKIHTTDGAGNNPWAAETTLSFKAVLIKGAGLKKHPNINLYTYEQTKKAFHLSE